MKLILQAIKSLFRKVYIATASAVETAESAAQKVDSKMDKENPEATGTFNVSGKGDNGEYSTSIGLYSKAATKHSTAIGYMAETLNGGDLAMGSATKAAAQDAIAIGTNVNVNGLYAIGIGHGLNVHGNNSIVMGMRNKRDWEHKYLFILGNGYGQYETNALTIDFDGNAWFAGSVEGTAIILTSPNGTRYKVAVDDSGALIAATV